MPARRSMALSLGLLCLSCAAASASAQSRTWVPARPPDSVWVDVWANEDPEWAAPVDVFLLTFRPDVDVTRKQTVVEDVEGVVVGGMPASPDSPIEGMYVVRVRTGDIECLLDVIAKLQRKPEVLAAGLLTRLDTPR